MASSIVGGGIFLKRWQIGRGLFYIAEHKIENSCVKFLWKSFKVKQIRCIKSFCQISFVKKLAYYTVQYIVAEVGGPLISSANR
jgi:hypothetical protein